MDQETLLQCIPYVKYAESPSHSFNSDSQSEKYTFYTEKINRGRGSRNFYYARMKRQMCRSIDGGSLDPSEAIGETIVWPHRVSEQGLGYCDNINNTNDEGDTVVEWGEVDSGSCLVKTTLQLCFGDERREEHAAYSVYSENHRYDYYEDEMICKVEGAGAGVDVDPDVDPDADADPDADPDADADADADPDDDVDAESILLERVLSNACIQHQLYQY